MSYVLSTRAEADLVDAFADSLTRWGEAQARRYAERIESRLQLLAQFPDAGRARPDLGADIRSIPVGSHIVFYRRDGADVLILHVRHAKREQPEER